MACWLIAYVVLDALVHVLHLIKDRSGHEWKGATGDARNTRDAALMVRLVGFRSGRRDRGVAVVPDIDLYAAAPSLEHLYVGVSVTDQLYKMESEMRRTVLYASGELLEESWLPIR